MDKGCWEGTRVSAVPKGGKQKSGKRGEEREKGYKGIYYYYSEISPSWWHCGVSDPIDQLANHDFIFSSWGKNNRARA